MRIKVQIEDQKDKTNVGESLHKPMTNPLTVKIYHPIIELPDGFQATRMDMSSTKTVMANDALLKFQYSGTYGSFQETIWKGIDKNDLLS